MRHVLLPHHHEHLKKIGISEPPKHVEIPQREYDEHYRTWKTTLPLATHEELHTRTIAHAVWKAHCVAKPSDPVEVITSPITHHVPKWERYIIIALLLLIALFVFKGKAHAQFSHVNYVQFTGSSGTTISFFTAPFTIQCLSSMTCTPITGGISLAAASGGTGCTLPGGTNLLLYDTSTLCGDITKWSTNGTTTITGAATAILDLSAAATFKVPTSAGCAPTVNAVACYDSTAHLWVFGSNGATVDLCNTQGGTAGQVFESNGGTSCGGYADPIVSGPDAPGAVSTKNPVQVAGNDGTDVRAIATDSSGDTKVTGLGTAGSASGGVMTVQGVASMTKLLVTPDSVALPLHQSVNLDEIGGSALAIGQQLAAASIPVILPSATITTLTPPTPPTAAAIGTSVSGDLLIGTQVAGSSVPVALPTATITTLTPVTAAAIASAIVSNPPTVPVTQATGTNLHMVCDSGCSSSAGFADNSAFTVGTTAINPIGGLYDTGADPTITNGSAARARIDSHSYLFMDLATPIPAGTNVIGHVIADSGSTTAVTGNVAVTKADASDVTLGAKADAKSTATDTTPITAMQVLKEISAMEQAPASRAVTNAGTFEVQPDGTTASTTNAASRCVLASAASTNATNCKNGSGNVYGFRFVNTTTTVYYLRMYNLTTSPTCSSATGFVESIPIPPGPASGAAGGIVSIEPMGEGYSTGIGFCFTGGSSSTDNTNAATGVFGTILYR